MASVLFHEIAVSWVNPGQSAYWGWNNAPFGVYGWAGAPVAHENGAVTKIEVARVWQEHNYGAGKSTAWVRLDNIGAFGGFCFCFMSQVLA